MMPRAILVHQSPARLRLRIRERAGDEDYFVELLPLLRDLDAAEAIQVAPLTGSILMTGLRREPEEILGLARERGLFELRELAEAPLPRIIEKAFSGVNRRLRRHSGGEIDVRSTIFLLLVGSGLYQIARGNLMAPPWYSAFWFAFGLYTQGSATAATEGVADGLPDNT